MARKSPARRGRSTANSAAHRSIHQLNDLSRDLVAQIEHFFVSYNEMKGEHFGRGAPAAGELVHSSWRR
jgi:hypothetical protein